MQFCCWCWFDSQFCCCCYHCQQQQEPWEEIQPSLAQHCFFCILNLWVSYQDVWPHSHHQTSWDCLVLKMKAQICWVGEEFCLESKYSSGWLTCPFPENYLSETENFNWKVTVMIFPRSLIFLSASLNSATKLLRRLVSSLSWILKFFSRISCWCSKLCE